jgi:hypothetical protein
MKSSFVSLIALVCANQVLAQQTWQNQYPVDKPEPKAEWLALVKENPALQITPNILTAGKEHLVKMSNLHILCRWRDSKRRCFWQQHLL